MIKKYYVYILASEGRGALYIGMTCDLKRRVLEHQMHVNKGFTHEYNVYKLVYFEKFNYVNDAIIREKRLKKWNRAWKENLINSNNPLWHDLSTTL